MHRMNWRDYVITLVSADRSVVEQLRPQFFTDFHQILHSAWNCGWVDAYCFWDKLVAELGFWMCANFNFDNFSIVVAAFLYGSSQKSQQS